jgi:hypothetical protein
MIKSRFWKIASWVRSRPGGGCTSSDGRGDKVSGLKMHFSRESTRCTEGWL